MNAPVHIILQGKGGVGKTFVAAMLAQYLKRDGGPGPLCIDTDPVNASFSGYKSLDVRTLAIVENGEVNKRGFDAVVELIAANDVPTVIDNGASSFLPLSAYLLANGVLALLHDMGRPVILHTVVTGGQALLDTVQGFTSMATSYPIGADMIVWLNPYWGPIELDGRTFETFTAIRTHKSRITGVISIPLLDTDTFGHDLANMLSDHLTFDEAANDTKRPIMVRQRLAMTRRSIFGEISKVPIL
jgi:hypothetical protein